MKFCLNIVNLANLNFWNIFWNIVFVILAIISPMVNSSLINLIPTSTFDKLIRLIFLIPLTYHWIVFVRHLCLYQAASYANLNARFNTSTAEPWHDSSTSHNWEYELAKGDQTSPYLIVSEISQIEYILR